MLDVRPVTPDIGAEVHGIDLSRSLASHIVDAVRAAWLEHLVLFFVDQELTPEQQLAFAAQFGEVTAAHPIEPALEELPLDVVKLDIDANPKTAERYGVLSLPTVILFADGEPRETVYGARPKKHFEKAFSEYLKGV